MPAQEVSRLHQLAVLWEASTSDPFDLHGEPQVGAAAEINTRWERAQIQSVDVDGTPIAISDTIFVEQDIEVGSIVRLGAIADLPDPVEDGLVQVLQFEKAPDIKGRKYTRALQVRKWRDALPTIV